MGLDRIFRGGDSFGSAQRLALRLRQANRFALGLAPLGVTEFCGRFDFAVMPSARFAVQTNAP
jgi:hypothetical protein